MNNKGVGAIFCLIAAILMGVRYLSAAIFMSSTLSWDSSLFRAGLTYIGPALPAAAILALVVGVAFLGFALYQDRRDSRK